MTPPPASAVSPKPDVAPPKPEIGDLKQRPVELRDLRIRLLGIPFFGLAIPHLTGLLGPLGAGDRAYWAGLGWFVLLSFLIWQGNRFFLVEQRRYYDWFLHPWRKVSLLLFANIFYTAPLTVAMLVAWYRVAPLPGPDWRAIQLVTLANVICVVFITHVYETVYLIQQREGDQVAVARLEQARAEAELQALKAQVDPHFLFNSLNTLAHLIPHDPSAALRFTEGLADVYRYILGHGRRDLVPLADELRFARGYAELLRLRFGDALRLRVDARLEQGAWLVPPLAVQLLVENAAQHNAFDAAAPLEVALSLDQADLVAENALRPRLQPRPSAGLGLRNLEQRCRHTSGRGLEIDSSTGAFRVRLPLVGLAA